MNSELNTFLMALRDAINKNPHQFDRAKTDSMYDAYRTQVNTLLNDMYKEVKTNAEREFSELEYSIEKMKKWFDNEYASREDIQKYKLIHDKIFVCKYYSGLKTQSYFGYDDALKIIRTAKKESEGIQDSIRNDLRTCQNIVESKSNRIIDLPNRINKIRANKIGNFVKYLVFSITCIILLISTYTYVGSDPPFPAFIVSMGDFITSIIMLPIMLIVLAFMILGLPASIWYFFKAINNFLKIFTSEEINKLRKEKKELNEQVIALNNKITIANMSLI